jgi:hypothetical protein
MLGEINQADTPMYITRGRDLIKVALKVVQVSSCNILEDVLGPIYVVGVGGRAALGYAWSPDRGHYLPIWCSDSYWEVLGQGEMLRCATAIVYSNWKYAVELNQVIHAWERVEEAVQHDQHLSQWLNYELGRAHEGLAEIREIISAAEEAPEGSHITIGGGKVQLVSNVNTWFIHTELEEALRVAADEACISREDEVR